MSYEGYEQHICAKGHRFDTDCGHMFDHREDKCHCGAKSVFCNSVDDTNCISFGIIPESEWEKLQLTPAKQQTCNLGHVHVVEEATYRVPENGGRDIQYYRKAASRWEDVYINILNKNIRTNR